MTTNTGAELDDATKQRLAAEVERLVLMDIDRKTARRIVWDDYLDELAAYLPHPPINKEHPPQPEPQPLETPVPEPPTDIPVTKPMQTVQKAPFFTPERMQRNRIELAKVKRLIGIRN